MEPFTADLCISRLHVLHPQQQWVDSGSRRSQITGRYREIRRLWGISCMGSLFSVGNSLHFKASPVSALRLNKLKDQCHLQTYEPPQRIVDRNPTDWTKTCRYSGMEFICSWSATTVLYINSLERVVFIYTSVRIYGSHDLFFLTQTRVSNLFSCLHELSVLGIKSCGVFSFQEWSKGNRTCWISVF